MNSNFYSLWFDPTGYRTRVYRFGGRRSIHSTTDRLFNNNNYEVNAIFDVSIRSLKLQSEPNLV